MPFYRELALMWGAMSVKYVSIKNALLNSNDPEHPLNKKDGLTSNAVSDIKIILGVETLKLKLIIFRS